MSGPSHDSAASRRALLRSLGATVVGLGGSVGLAGCGGRSGVSTGTPPGTTRSPTPGESPTAPTSMPTRTPTPSPPRVPGVVEDAESELVGYGGDTAAFARSRDALSGSSSLVGYSEVRASYPTISSVSGLARYPRAGDAFSCTVRLEVHSMYGGVLWGTQSATADTEGYRLRIDDGGTPTVELERVGPGMVDNRYAVSLSEVECVPKPNHRYTVSVEWHTDGRMPYRITRDDGSVLAADDDPTPDRTYDAGGIGFMVNTTWEHDLPKVCRFDDFVLTRTAE